MHETRFTPSSAPAALIGHQSSAPNIMVVDDETTIRLGCVMSARSEGFAVSGERSSVQALEKLLAGTMHFDAVVLDYAMPELGGLAFAQSIFAAKNEGRALPPIVMLSAYADGAVAFSALKFGIWDFLNKPFMPEDVRSKVWSMIRRRAAAQGEGGSLERALLCCQACDWTGALRQLDTPHSEGEERRNKRELMRGLIAQILGRDEEARQAFQRTNWWPEWHLQGPEIWPEIARRLM